MRWPSHGSMSREIARAALAAESVEQPAQLGARVLHAQDLSGGRETSAFMSPFGRTIACA